jgi:hypothetical protein
LYNYIEREIEMTQDIRRSYNTLPPDAQRQVRDFIAFLQARQKKAEKQSIKTSPELAEEAFVGIWRDRADIANGALWVREARNKEWGKQDE